MRPLVLITVLLFVSPTFGQQPKAITNSIGMKLVLILPGSFKMGSPIEEEGRGIEQEGLSDSETEHLVTISNWYYLGIYEVTQEQYERVMGNNPSHFKRLGLPVDQVSWDDAISFCMKLSVLPEEKAAGREYRLPTEAEWEFACRAGSTTAYYFGDTPGLLGEYGWFGEGLEGRSHPVGQKKPNKLGLYDMHGNVWEWCQDWHERSPTGVATDPQGPQAPSHGSGRVFRGGSARVTAGSCRSATRPSWTIPARNDLYYGFRVAMSLPAKQPESASSK